MRRRRLAGKASPPESPALTEELAAERLSSLSRELREDVVEALVAEGERVWEALSSRLQEHMARIETEARGDDESIRAEIPTRGEIEALIAEAAEKEFAKATERIASMLLIQRKQSDAFLERELQTLREELRPKLVMRRAEIPAPEEAAHRREALSD